MTTLLICWFSIAGICVQSETYDFWMPYLHQNPGHFECGIAERLWIDKFSDQGIEPESIECIKQGQ